MRKKIHELNKHQHQEVLRKLVPYLLQNIFVQNTTEKNINRGGMDSKANTRTLSAELYKHQ